jgi:hypothetical protein
MLFGSYDLTDYHEEFDVVAVVRRGSLFRSLSSGISCSFCCYPGAVTPGRDKFGCFGCYCWQPPTPVSLGLTAPTTTKSSMWWRSFVEAPSFGVSLPYRRIHQNSTWGSVVAGSATTPLLLECTKLAVFYRGAWNWLEGYALAASQAIARFYQTYLPGGLWLLGRQPPH